MSNARDHTIELSEPLMQARRIPQKKSILASEEIKECIDIIKNAKRKAYLLSNLMSLAMLAGAGYLFYWCYTTDTQIVSDTKKEMDTEDNMQQLLKAKIAGQFNQTWYADPFYYKKNDTCNFYFPNAYPMMELGSRTECCPLKWHQWNYEPCTSIPNAYAPPCFEVIDQYCRIEPTIFMPSAQLNGLIAGMWFASGMIAANLANACANLIINNIHKHLMTFRVLVCCTSSTIENCFISSKDKEKLSAVAEKHRIWFNDRSLAKSLCCFEDAFQEKTENLFTFFRGAHKNNPQSSVQHLVRNELYDKNAVHLITEFMQASPASNNSNVRLQN